MYNIKMNIKKIYVNVIFLILIAMVGLSILLMPKIINILRDKYYVPSKEDVLRCPTCKSKVSFKYGKSYAITNGMILTDIERVCLQCNKELQ